MVLSADKTELRFKVAICNGTSSRRFKVYAHWFRAFDGFFDYHPQGNSKKCHTQVYGNFVWEFQVRYNNQKWHPEEYDYQQPTRMV